MIKLVGFSGSLHRGAYNAALLRAASELMPNDSELTIESIAGIPLYNADEESQNAWLPVLRTLGADLWSGGRLLLSQASTVVGAEGAITDAATRENIRKFMAGFVKFVSKEKRAGR